MMQTRRTHGSLEDLPDGYKDSALVGTDMPLSTKDLDNGYCPYPGIDLNDMFGAFERVTNWGLAGGDKTVDDYDTEGLETHAGGVRDGDDDDDDYEVDAKRYP